MREVLPQVTLLGHAALAVSHGGNNSVTEALTAGVPMLLLPLSTDQFAGAAALEDAGLAEVLDANALSHTEIREAAHACSRLAGEPRDRLGRPRGRAGRRPGRVPGPDRPARRPLSRGRSRRP